MPQKTQFLAIFNPNFDSFRMKILSKDSKELSSSYEWSEIGSLSLLLDQNQSLCLKSRFFLKNSFSFENFNFSICATKFQNKSIISINYPMKITNLLPFDIKIRIKDLSFLAVESRNSDFERTFNKRLINELLLKSKRESLNEEKLAKELFSEENLEKSKEKLSFPKENSKFNEEKAMNGKLSQKHEENEINGKLSPKHEENPNKHEESIASGTSFSTNSFEFRDNFALSLLLPSHKWSEFLELSPDNDESFEKPLDSSQIPANSPYFQKTNGFSSDLRYFQNFNEKNEQTTVILERKLEKGLYHLVFFTEFWILNETSFQITAKIKENNYEYSMIKLPQFSINLQEKPHFSQNLAGFSNLSMQKNFETFGFFDNPFHQNSSEIHQNSSETHQNLYYNQQNSPNFGQNSSELHQNSSNFGRYSCLNSAFFSMKELKDLLKNPLNSLSVFSGNIEKINKKIAFRIENSSKWSENLKIIEKSSVFLKENHKNLFNFSFLNVKLPGKYNKTSLLLISPKVFLVNLTGFMLEIKLIEKNEKRNIVKIEAGNIANLFNFEDENEIKIAVRVPKNEFLWTSA